VVASQERPNPALPLAGIRILYLTTVMLGPYATQMLGDYGADVIKVEAPEGDSTRKTGPAKEPGMAAAFIGANRSKRSIVLDLKQEAARNALLTLVENADALVYSMRPRKMLALGLGPDVLRARNPSLIVVSAHGFADDGPYAGRPAYDDIIQGLSGLASLNELKGGEPAYVPSVIADKTCALFTAQSLLMALVARSRTGVGCFVEVPMFEAMVNFTLVEHFYGAHFRPALSPPGYPRLTTSARRPYRTTDGYVCVLPYTDTHWKQFFIECGREDLLNDPRFAGQAARTQNIDALYSIVAECVAARSTADWLAACDRLDIPAAKVNRLSELEDDPHLVHTDYFVTLKDPAMGDLVMPGSPVEFDGETPVPGLPPRLGQHTAEVLEEAGLSAEAIHELLATGAAMQRR
jgi:crotonobetainyl-CoA:carnitine CoA-transferase CaiB-like acyl-CoA transferase